MRVNNKPRIPAFLVDLGAVPADHADAAVADELHGEDGAVAEQLDTRFVDFVEHQAQAAKRVVPLAQRVFSIQALIQERVEIRDVIGSNRQVSFRVTPTPPLQCDAFEFQNVAGNIRSWGHSLSFNLFRCGGSDARVKNIYSSRRQVGR